jgi:hypothetical protein
VRRRHHRDSSSNGATLRAGRVLPSSARLALALSAVLLLVPAASGAARKSAEGTFVQTTTFRMSEPDEKRRGAVVCPGGKTVTPLGGGMTTSPEPGPDGEGVYPHSYERLGAQRGFHVTPVLYDPSPAHTTPRDVTLQVVCGPKSSHIAPIRNTVYVVPGETKTAEATCPGKRRLFSGGFQRTNFVTRGGNYVTGSRAISDKTWQVTGSAFGKFGGELTAIAYCRSSRKPLVTEVSGTATVASEEYGTATTTTCPGQRQLVAGGFQSFPSGSSFLTDGRINPDGTWSAAGFNAFGPSAVVTAYGYCHRPSFPKAGKAPNPHRSAKAPPALQRAEKAAISERVLHDGCYPGPAKLAQGIRSRTGLRTGVAPAQGGVNHHGKVYVLSQGASCHLSRLAMLKQGRVFTINSGTGVVTVK